MWHFKRMGVTRRPMNEGSNLLFMLYWAVPMTASFLHFNPDSDKHHKIYYLHDSF